MQAYWNQFAFVRLVLLMMLGIFMSYVIENAFLPVIVTFLISFLSYLFIVFNKPANIQSPKAILLGFFAFVMCISSGYLNTYLQAERYNKNHLLNYDISQVEAFTAILNSEGKATEKSYGFDASITAVKIENRWRKLVGQGKLYLEKSEQMALLQYGDELLFSSGLQKVGPPRNPNEFDYQAYLTLSQCYFQQYITADKIQFLHADQGNVIMAFSYKASQYLSKQLHKYIPNEQAFAIANALTLGIKDDLDNELKTAYAAAGAMHVLAVSGLHVGIIFMIVAFAFKRWRNQKWGRWLYAGTSLLVLWSFAFITGLSPSVMRAATMFSFVVIAQASRRHTNIYNTLAASAFLLLLIDPYLLFSVGFQLSYLAVVGIVYFQPKIQLLLPIKYKWLDRLWALTSVSIAAQLVTAPLGMFYFHQFPTYFFLSNIIVIPAAFIILNGSLIIMVCSLWPVVATAVGGLLNWFIQWVNQAIFWLQKLPHSTLEGIYFTSSEIVLLYVMLLLFAFFIFQKSYYYWVALFCCICIFSSSIIYRQYKGEFTERLMVHSTPKESTISYLKAEDAFIYTSTAPSKENTVLKYHVLPYLQASGASLVSIDSSFAYFPLRQADWHGFKLLEYQGSSLVQVSEAATLKLNKRAKILKIDYLILRNNVWRESSVIFELFSPQLVIIDGSNSYYHIKKLQKWLDKMEINYYIVPESGAFEFKI
ncbi:MAG: competence protein ComEC [Marivirga sp.]|jgi:competence protein ComEC